LRTQTPVSAEGCEENAIGTVKSQRASLALRGAPRAPVRILEKKGDVGFAFSPENRTSSGRAASREAQRTGVPSFPKSPPRSPRIRVKLSEFGS
jgi:hypothetical protein